MAPRKAFEGWSASRKDGIGPPALDEESRSVIRKFWNDAPYPADPVYLLGMLHDIEKGRIRLDRPPPWRPTEEEIARGRAAIARFSEKLKAQSGERAR